MGSLNNKKAIEPLVHLQHKPKEEIDVALQQLPVPLRHPIPSEDHRQTAAVTQKHPSATCGIALICIIKLTRESSECFTTCFRS